MPPIVPPSQTNSRLVASRMLKMREAHLAESNSFKVLKQGIWLYFLLLIFEGALRKWFLPGLANPLLIIRDPVAAWLLIMCFKRGLLPSTIYLTGMVAIGVIGTITAFLLGHHNLVVALYGARILLIHFPMIFVIGSVFTREDVVKVGKITLCIAIPMAILTALQFYSPQSAWVNRGVGGDIEGAGFSGAMGFFRPPGTFSFTNGNSLFFSFVAPFVIYFWIYPKSINRLLLIAATFSLLAAIPLSISRSLFFSICVSLLFTVIAIVQKPKYAGKMIGAGIMLLIALIILNQTAFFQTATEAFTARFETANEVEGGVESVFLDRYLGGMIGALQNSSQQPLFGFGLGMGTNVGSLLLSGGRTFLISEGEWGRIVGELGPVLGLTMIFIRLALSWKIALACFRQLSVGHLLPWILLSFCLLNLPQGQWAQPTSLGFSIIIGGLVMASLKKESKKKS